ncbi:sigma-70 family RNA polymerase sigma factor [Tautonia plasticadhaerens]|uniref:ECF RNA polymerase sigma factor SigM n=1 Tax=Tautonia plasticadhaerens TaxID=2527974 RepID=A0A518H5E3_9BACT|nr:sigma-70 family RNA polymerase sigma factor [Tautonia plasticadhaerens]QDV36052.1 ECF RNA polymerase sigma factor SigM [Tautonia plasticadhaerens]
MGSRSTGATLRHLRSIFEGGSLAGLADGELIDRFLDGDRPRADAAFSALVDRHGPMVHRVCRGVLGRSNEADADDAFQAVFLVLARRAGSLRGRDSIAPWLFGVARRVSRKARVAASRRSRHERIAAGRRTPAVPDEADRRDDWSALYDEIDRLPPAFRAPVVLCGLEGRSAAEAASALGVAEGTIHSRLSRARDRLRRRLSRQGVALGLPPLPFAPRAASSGPPEALIDATIRLAWGLAAGRVATGEVPAAVAILAASLSRRTLLMKAGLSISLVALALGPASAGLGIGSLPDEPPPPTAGEATPSTVDVPDDGEPLHVLVVEQDGTPAPGVPVRVENFVFRGTFVTDDDGRAVVPGRARGMSLIAVRGASPQVGGNEAGPGDRPRAIGYWTNHGRSGTEDDPATITLQPLTRPVTVQVLDESGRPVEGARVFVDELMDRGPFGIGIRRLEGIATLDRDGSIGLFGELTTGRDGSISIPLPDKTWAFLSAESRHRSGLAVNVAARAESPPPIILRPAGGIAGLVTDSHSGEPAEGIQVVATMPNAPVDFSVSLPYEARTGPDGRYLIPGASPGVYVVRILQGPEADRLARDVVGVRVEVGRDSLADLRLDPSRRLSGAVYSVDDGRPLPGVGINLVNAEGAGHHWGNRFVESDAYGRFSISMLPGEYRLLPLTTEYAFVADPRPIIVPEDRDPAPIRLACSPRPEPRSVVLPARRGLPSAGELGQFAVNLIGQLGLVYWGEGQGHRVVRGRVVDEQGMPVAGVHIWNIRDEDRDASGIVRAIAVDGKSATTDREGVFVLGNQHEGELTLGLWKLPSDLREEVVGSGRDEVEFTLPIRR